MRETHWSLLILTVLVAISLGVFITQFQLNPAISVFNSKSSENPGIINSTKYKTFLPEGSFLRSSIETFGANNLFEKINGGADIYLSSGFVWLQSLRFAKNENKANLVEIFIYYMGNSQNAFSVFSSQRPKNPRSLKLTKNSYKTQNALFFTHGAYYLRIISSDISKDSFELAYKFALNFIKGTPVKSEKSSESETGLFPLAGLDVNSVRIISSNGFGFEKLDQVYIADYKTKDGMVSAFISKRETADEARILAEGYKSFLEEYDGKHVNGTLDDMVIIEIMDSYEIFFFQDRYFGGVHEAGSIDQARKLAESLREKLKKQTI